MQGVLEWIVELPEICFIFTKKIGVCSSFHFATQNITMENRIFGRAQAVFKAAYFETSYTTHRIYIIIFPAMPTTTVYILKYT